jgi:Ca-activated chloride channel family protein
MKIRTVGALAALGMSLTSYSVWSLTGESTPRRTAVPADTVTVVTPSHSDTTGASSSSDGSLRLDARLGHARLPRGLEDTFVLVKVRADQNAVGRPEPRSLVIAIDRSGSMSGKRLANAIAAARGAVARLADGDSVSVIDYANAAHLFVAPTVLGPETRASVDRRLATLSAGGETCISCALETALELSRERDAGVERVLLLSDGEATAGVRDVNGMRRLGDRLRAAGATVTTIGVDVDYNERMMTAIAQAANGHHYFVASPDGLSAIFDRELSGLEHAVARQAKVDLELAPGVELVEIADHAFERNGSHVSVELGSLAAGEERSVLARVQVRWDGAAAQSVVTASVRYQDLASGSVTESSRALVAAFSEDGSRSPLDPEVEERLQRSGAAAALTDANDLFTSGNVVAARERVAKKLAEVQSEHAVAIAAAPAPARVELSERFDKQEAALGAAASAFAEPPPSASADPESRRQSKVVVKENAERAADLAF